MAEKSLAPQLGSDLGERLGGPARRAAEDRVGIGVFQPFPPADGPGGDGVDVERSSSEDGDRVFWAQRLA